MKDKWIENALSFLKYDDAGKCPECGAAVTVEKYENPHRDSYSFKCTKCQAGAHFDGTYKE